MNTSEDPSATRVFDPREHRLPRLPALVATGSLASAAVHAWVVRSHASHWWGYAAFFAALAVAQAMYAGVVLRRPSRAVVVAGVGGTVAVLALYAWSRTIGVPLGPHAGRAETVGAVDLIAAFAEGIVVVAGVLMLRGPKPAPRPLMSRPAMTAALVTLVAAGMAGPAGHAHPRPSPVRLADGPETWVGPLPTQATEPATPEPTPTIEPTTPAEPTPSEEPIWTCAPKAASGFDVPPSAEPGHARAVVSSYEGVLYLYLPSDDVLRPLTQKNDNCWPGRPSFRDPSYVTFHADSGIYGLDLSDGELHELVKSKHGIAAAAWSPDRKALAYLTYGSGDNGGPQLVMLNPADGSKEVVRTFDSGGGRCGGEDDETTLEWAPDGHALIVVATFLDFSSETMFVLDRHGKDLVPPRLGTHARWAPNSERIYYRDFTGDRKWYALNSATGDRGTLGAMKPGTHGLAVSQDGAMLAYADGEDDVGVYVYDVAQKKQRRIAEDAVEPVWIGPRTVLVTNTKPCGDECLHSAWMPAGTGSVVDVVTEDKEKIALGSTLDAMAWLEEPAQPPPASAPPPPAPAPTPSETPEPDPSTSPTPSAEPTPTPTSS